MDRVFESGAAGTPPDAPASPSSGYPSSGNPATATPATKPGPYWYHMITESMRRVIVAAGLTPDHANLDRFKDAIVALASSALTTATEAVAGVLRIATQAETNAGTADDRIVTPKKLKFGFLISLGATNSYIVFPDWMGGLIIQFGKFAGHGASATTSVTFPVAFPSVLRSIVLTGADLTNASVYDQRIFGTPSLSSFAVGSGTSVSNGGWWLAVGN